MRLHCKKTIYFLGLLLTSSLLFSNAMAACSEKYLARRVQTFMKQYHIRGAAVVVANKGNIKTCVFGEAIAAKHIPVTADTLFELGSITKTFTGVVLAESIAAGKAQLTEPIQRDSTMSYSRALGKVTYLELATHTSGLPFNTENMAYNAADSAENQIELRNYLKKTTPSFQPGSYMLYSNIGFGILGQILAEKEHISLSELMQRDILTPLKMDASGLDISHQNQKHLAQGYSAAGKPVHYRPSGLFGGSWAMRSSARDMQCYLSAALGEQTTPSNIRQAMLYSQTAYYDMPSEDMQIGLGWLITPLNKASNIQKLIHQPEHYQFIPYRAIKIQKPIFNPNTLIGKAGATDGFRAYIAVIPAKHTGIAIMINRFLPSNGALTNLANGILLQESHIPI